EPPGPTQRRRGPHAQPGLDAVQPEGAIVKHREREPSVVRDELVVDVELLVRGKGIHGNLLPKLCANRIDCEGLRRAIHSSRLHVRRTVRGPVQISPRSKYRRCTETSLVQAE